MKSGSSQNSNFLNSVSKDTKYCYFLLPFLPIRKERELPNYTNVVLPSGVIPTYFGECYLERTWNLKKETENKKFKE